MYNTVKTGILLSVLTILFIAIGNALGGQSGAFMAFAFAIIMNMGSYWFSDKIVLAMTRAKPVSESEAPALYSMVSKLSKRAQIPVPRLYIVPDASPNAFATGRDPKHGVVAVNQGLLNLLNPQEIEGVIAHELGHIKHRDTLTSAIVATIAGAIMMLANMAKWAMIFGGNRDREEGENPFGMLVMAIIAPIAAMMIQMAVSRAREFEADRAAAEFTGTGQGLITALQKLETGVAALPGQMSPSNAHMCIVNPLAGSRSSLINLFSTHPPIEKRIEKLLEFDRIKNLS